jgi:hypothetical protein
MSPALLPPGLLPFAAAILIATGGGPNSTMAFSAVAVLIVGSSLLWRPRQSPVFLIAFLYQWLQASIWTFYANWEDKPIDEIGQYHSDAAVSTALSLVGLLIWAFGIRLGMGPIISLSASTLHASKQNVEKWFTLYVGSVFIAFVSAQAANMLPALTQPLLALSGLQWAFFYAIGYVSMQQRGRALRLFLIAFGFQLLLAMGAFFSEFRTVFLVTLMAALASGAKPTPRAAFGITIIFVGLLSFALVWTAVKRDYRDFVSGGEAQQIVAVDFPTRISKLVELVSELDGAKLDRGVDQLIRRIGYVEFFGSVLDYVPRIVPHENGQILIDALMRPFMPRVFFPEKTIIDDSERTTKYTGLRVSGSDKGTSISLGWLAEIYIDFGYYGFMPAIMLIGLAYGRIFRMLTRMGDLLGMGLATALFLPLMLLESSITKVLGGIFTSLLVILLLSRYLLPFIRRWLEATEQK